MRARSLLRAAVLLTAVAVHPAAVGEDDVVDRPVLKAGDRWVYRVLRVVQVLGRRRMHRRDGGFDVPVRETVWYSPDVKNFVKREIRWLESGPGGANDRTIWELVEYEVR